MTTPSFDPQPCCGDGEAVSDVNIVGPDPLNVMVANQLADPLDVNLIGPDPVNVVVTNQLTEPLDVNLIGPDPVNVTVVNQLTEPLDVNVLTSATLSLGGSAAASSTLTTATTGNGSTVDFTVARSNVTMFVQVNGTVTGGVVALQGSQDGVNWVRIAASGQLATGTNQYVAQSGGAFRWFRGVVTENVAGGGTVTATLMFG
jgi:hypothetical protein